MPYPPYLNPDLQIEYLFENWGLKRSKKTLAKERCTGLGPRFVRMGRNVASTTAHLDDYARSKLSRRDFGSTTEAKAEEVG